MPNVSLFLIPCLQQHTMKTFKKFAYLYCVLLYTLGLLYAINEFIAFHFHHEFFEGYRTAVPLLIFIFFHLPVFPFFIVIKERNKWLSLLLAMVCLFLCVFLSFQAATLIVPNIMLIALFMHTRDLIRALRLSNSNPNL